MESFAPKSPSSRGEQRTEITGGMCMSHPGARGLWAPPAASAPSACSGPELPCPLASQQGTEARLRAARHPQTTRLHFGAACRVPGPRARCAVHVVSRSEASGWVPPSPVSLSNRGARAHPQSPRALVPSLRRGAHVEVCLCRAPSPDGDSSERSQIFRGKGAAGGWAGSLGCQAAHCRR